MRHAEPHIARAVAGGIAPASQPLAARRLPCGPPLRPSRGPRAREPTVPSTVWLLLWAMIVRVAGVESSSRVEPVVVGGLLLDVASSCVPEGSVAGRAAGRAVRGEALGVERRQLRRGLLNENRTGLDQIVGQLYDSNRDFQSKCWAKSCNLGQPCAIFVRTSIRSHILS
jgi:hypothetical protein